MSPVQVFVDNYEEYHWQNPLELFTARRSWSQNWSPEPWANRTRHAAVVSCGLRVSHCYLRSMRCFIYSHQVSLWLVIYNTPGHISAVISRKVCLIHTHIAACLVSMAVGVHWRTFKNIEHITFVNIQSISQTFCVVTSRLSSSSKV